MLVKGKFRPSHMTERLFNKFVVCHCRLPITFAKSLDPSSAKRSLPKETVIGLLPIVIFNILHAG